MCKFTQMLCMINHEVDDKLTFFFFFFQEVEVINNVQDLLKKTIKETDAQIK